MLHMWPPGRHYVSNDADEHEGTTMYNSVTCRATISTGRHLEEKQLWPRAAGPENMSNIVLVLRHCKKCEVCMLLKWPQGRHSVSATMPTSTRGESRTTLPPAAPQFRWGGTRWKKTNVPARCVLLKAGLTLYLSSGIARSAKSVCCARGHKVDTVSAMMLSNMLGVNNVHLCRLPAQQCRRSGKDSKSNQQT